MDDVGDDALEVAIALAEVQRAEASVAHAVVGVGLEDRSGTLTLRSPKSREKVPMAAKEREGSLKNPSLPLKNSGKNGSKLEAFSGP